MAIVTVSEKWVDELIKQNEILEATVRSILAQLRDADFDTDFDQLLDKVEIMGVQALRKVAPPGLHRTAFALDLLWTTDDELERGDTNE